MDLREQLCDICHAMWLSGMIAANDGNVSVLLDDERILCTPSGVSKREITPEMLVITDREGHVIEGDCRVSTELAMHLRCYRERADVRAVVHAHPPMATTFAVADQPLDDYAMIETITTLGAVPVAPYAVPGSEEVPDAIAPFLPNHDAILLRAHGAITVGCDLKTAYYRMESLEHFAKITLFSKILGGAKELSQDQIQTLIARRTSFYRLTGRHPGYEKF